MKIQREIPFKVKSKRGRPKGKKGVGRKRYISVKRFVAEYLVDLNGAAAYRRCGYGTGDNVTDATGAARLLSRADVLQCIAEAEEERSKRVEITQDLVLKGLRLLAMANIRDIATWDGERFVLKPFNELTRDQTYIISSMKIMPKQFGGIDLEFKTPSASDQRACLVDLGKHLGMFWEGNKQEDPIEGAKKIRQALEEMEERTAPKQ